MRWFLNLLSTSIGKKMLMAITGLFLILFLGEHLYSNLHLYAGEEVFNDHAEKMAQNLIVRIVEVGLFLAIVAHTVNGIRLAIENRRARPQRYRLHRSAGFKTLASRSMIISGSIIFVFLILHLGDFFWKARFGTVATGHSLYQIVTETFSLPIYSALYVVAMILVGLHLSHGFLSALRTMGLEHKRYTPVLRSAGILIAISFAAGFSSIPIFFYFRSLGQW